MHWPCFPCCRTRAPAHLRPPSLTFSRIPHPYDQVPSYVPRTAYQWEDDNPSWTPTNLPFVQNPRRPGSPIQPLRPILRSPRTRTRRSSRPRRRVRIHLDEDEVDDDDEPLPPLVSRPRRRSSSAIYEDDSPFLEPISSPRRRRSRIILSSPPPPACASPSTPASQPWWTSSNWAQPQSSPHSWGSPHCYHYHQQPTWSPTNQQLFPPYINPDLQNPRGFIPYLDWDLRTFSSSARRILPGGSVPADLDGPATYPPTHLLTVTFSSNNPMLTQLQTLWGPIVVHGLGHTPITVENVLRAIYLYFNRPLTHVDRMYFSDHTWGVISAAYRRRVPFSPDLPAVAAKRGALRVDVLDYLTKFGGLQSVGHNHLHLTFGM
ncbi:hypothetical protein R3P38DRAFT_2883179 [Favolaschia claudopus]|uniref:DUF6699 domain-containing protein n=1 Tax=Favolaschia claudopus TaxID=2862362 RepID=A0AAW0D1V5_9AGAR